MENEVQRWIEQLQQGDSRAAQQLWEGYFDRLVRMAQRRMADLPRRVADEEDVALSALNSFVRGARKGRFPLLADENDLWRLLVTITARKATAQRRRQNALRRGKVRGESFFAGADDSGTQRGIDGIAGKEPTPQFAAEVAEQLRALLDQLEDPILQDIAGWRLEGYSNEEIAEKIGRSTRAVERKVRLIRDCWSAPAADEADEHA